MIPATLSVLNEGMRETFIRRATGAALKTLSALYGLPMPGGWPEASWREALLAVALGPRGRPGGTLGFLLGAFRHFEEAVTVTRDPAQPRRISAAPGTFAQRHVGRWWRIGDEFYLSTGPADVAAAGGGYVELCPVATAYTAACDWGALAAADVVGVDLLGFTVMEPTPGPTPLPLTGATIPGTTGKACHVVVDLYDTAAIAVPPTYLQPGTTWQVPGTPDVERPAGEPYGGQIQGGRFDPPSYEGDSGDHGGTEDSAEEEDGDTESTPAAQPNAVPTRGPFAPYLTGERAAPGIEAALKRTLPVGYHALIRRAVT